MKKILSVILVLIVVVIIIFSVFYMLKKDKPSNINTASNVINGQTEGLKTVTSLDDLITTDVVWCGTFQLIWNDLKNEIAMQDIVFSPQLDIVQNLNKETFKESDISEESYYKVYGNPTPELKTQIEKAIKEKFNETSDILEQFNFNNTSETDYLLYCMLKKEFKFKYSFDILDAGDFGKINNVKYFGIDSHSNK